MIRLILTRSPTPDIYMWNANDWDQETRDIIDRYRGQYVDQEIDWEQYIETMDRMRTMKIAEES